MGQLALHAVVHWLCWRRQLQKPVPHARQKGKMEQTVDRWKHKETALHETLFSWRMQISISGWLLFICSEVRSLLLAPAGWNSKWDFFALLPNPEANDCQAGGMYLPVFVVSDGFVARGDLCYWVWKMNRDFAQAGFLSSCDAFKKQSAFLLTLLRKQDKPSINDHTFFCHFFLNVLGVKICALRGIQCFPFAQNHSLFLISFKASFHLLCMICLAIDNTVCF